MKKIYPYILLLLLIYVQPQSLTECLGMANSKSECLGRLSEDEIENGIHCCYFTTSSSNEGQCLYIEANEFNNFDNFFSTYEEKYKDVSIDCKSYYYELSILFLLLLNLL